MNRPYLIRDAKAIRLLASPLRQAMLDWIVTRGPATIAQLAPLVGRPADRLYYHVRALEKAGLLVQTPDSAAQGEAVYDVPGRPMFLDYGGKPGKQRRAVGRVVHALMRTAQRDFQRAATDASLTVAGPARELWSGRIEGSLSRAEIRKVNEHIEAVIRIFRRSTSRSSSARAHQFTWSLSPSSSGLTRPASPASGSGASRAAPARARRSPPG